MGDSAKRWQELDDRFCFDDKIPGRVLRGFDFHSRKQVVVPTVTSNREAGVSRWCKLPGPPVEDLNEPVITNSDMWRPFKTVPKDGTVVLVCTAGDPDSIRLASWKGDRLYKKLVFRSFNTPSVAISPTHWQPLPEAKEKSEDWIAAEIEIGIEALVRRVFGLIPKIKTGKMSPEFISAIKDWIKRQEDDFK